MQLLPKIKLFFLHGLGIFIFFFITLNTLNYTEGLLLKKVGIHFSFFEVTLVAFLLTKIVLILDCLPIRCIPQYPIIYRIIWKTLTYWIVFFTVRQLTRFLHYFHQSDWNKSEAWNLYLANLDVNFLIAFHIWFILLLSFFISTRELTGVLGQARMYQIFFGKIKKS